jgi:uncharacterized protein YggE
MQAAGTNAGRIGRPVFIGAAAVAALIAGAVIGGSTGQRTAGAQEVRAPEAAGITVVGDGVVRAVPDTTTVRLGVEVTARTPAEALTQTRERGERVLQRLRQLGLAEPDLQTTELNVFPIRGPSREPGGDAETVTGYRGTITITAQVRDVNQVPVVLTAAFEVGANAVHGISFGIRDDAALRRQALLEAIADARPKAEAAAGAAGLTLTGIRAIVEQPFGPPRGAAGLGGGEGVAPGELTVTVRAQVTFDVAR